MKIKDAVFVISNSELSKCPTDAKPEFAFIGRSNVGKSSLINMLTGKKSLAKTSGTPGKTQLINHFLINLDWHLVDLPGYGYARASKSQKKVFQAFITNYFEQRKQLVNAFLLIDIRHEPQPVDLSFMEWLGINQIPFSIVFTKADKLKPKAQEQNIAHYKREMLASVWEELPPVFITSSLHRTGGKEILNYIDQLNVQYRQNIEI